jgi:hypothetical protein
MILIKMTTMMMKNKRKVVSPVAKAQLQALLIIVKTSAMGIRCPK